MADSIRKRIMTAFDTRLRTILVVNGYATNAGANIYEWLTANLAVSSLPAIAYKDPVVSGGEVVTIAGPVDSQREFEMDVECTLISNGAYILTIIKTLAADLIRAVGVDPTWGGLALYTDLSGDDTEIEQHEETIGSCTVKVSITYRTKMWDTTAQ